MNRRRLVGGLVLAAFLSVLMYAALAALTDARAALALFALSLMILTLTGMTRHWWQERKRVVGWQKGLALNGVGLALTGGILLTVVAGCAASRRSPASKPNGQKQAPGNRCHEPCARQPAISGSAARRSLESGH